jgi:PAS domain S-box-containing protein
MNGITTMLSISKKVVKPAFRNSNSPDDMLWAIVDVCVSNVAVLDETGSLIYASRAWSCFELNVIENTGTGSTYFESCRRFPQSQTDEDASVTLADDIRRILFGEVKEFHHRYYFDSLIESRPFIVHAARLDLSESTFRVLVTREELSVGQEDFRDSKERLIELLGNKIMSWKGELEGQRFTYVSDHAVKILGYPVAAWYEPNFLVSHLHTDELDWVAAAYQKQVRRTNHFDLTFRLRAKDGRYVWVQNLISVSPQTDGTTKLHGFIIDISDRKRTEETLKDLGGRLIAAQEEERRRVARELHDDFNQRLAVLCIELEQLGRKMENSITLHRSVERLKTQAQELAAEIHRLSYKLHPAKLDHLGLAAAIKSLCTEITKNEKLKVEFYETGFPAALDKDITLCVFRIAQESLRNCVKHSRAESVRVVLTRSKNALRLLVSDNGCGFDTDSDSMERGLGFISMKERLHLVGGKINVYSKPLRGTRIEVSVPLKLQAVSSTTPIYSTALDE